MCAALVHSMPIQRIRLIQKAQTVCVRLWGTRCAENVSQAGRPANWQPVSYKSGGWRTWSNLSCFQLKAKCDFKIDFIGLNRIRAFVWLREERCHCLQTHRSHLQDSNVIRRIELKSQFGQLFSVMWSDRWNPFPESTNSDFFPFLPSASTHLLSSKI